MNYRSEQIISTVKFVEKTIGLLVGAYILLPSISFTKDDYRTLGLKPDQIRVMHKHDRFHEMHDFILGLGKNLLGSISSAEADPAMECLVGEKETEMSDVLNDQISTLPGKLSHKHPVKSALSSR